MTAQSPRRSSALNPQIMTTESNEESAKKRQDPSSVDDDIAAFIRSDSEGGEVFKKGHVQAPPREVHNFAAEKKTKKDRNRRASVNLRSDVRSILEGLHYHPLESVLLMDRPGPSFGNLNFNKFGTATNQRHFMPQLDVAQLWRAASRYYLTTNDESHGTKGRRKGEQAYDEFRRTAMGSMNSKLCVCMFRDTIEVQWTMQWGAYCRQCIGKAENQDGWAVVVPHESRGTGGFLSDEVPSNDSPNSTKHVKTVYSGFTNLHAEERCRYPQTSIPIPSADVTKFSETTDLALASVLHQSGRTYVNVDTIASYSGEYKRKRGLSLQAIRKMIGHDGKKKTNSAERAPVSIPRASELKPRLWCNQCEHHPVTTGPQFQNNRQVIMEGRRMVDTAAFYPWLKNSTQRQSSSQSENTNRPNYLPGCKVNPLQPAILCVLDGHGTGGKLGVSRASTSLAESLTLALSNISWLATSLGISMDNMATVINDRAYDSREMGIGDHGGSSEDVFFEKLGSTSSQTKNHFCSCRGDQQLLQHSTAFCAQLDPSDRENLTPTGPSSPRNPHSEEGGPSRTSEKEIDDSEPHCSTKSASFDPDVLETTRQMVLNLLSVSVRLAHSRILHENDALNRDFGATCTAMVVAGRYLFAAWVGDSPGVIVGIHKNKFGVIQLTNEHSLTNLHEQRRIRDFKGPNKLAEKDTRRRARRNSRGYIIETATAGDRLIPSHLPYAESRMQGLSINMSRAIGHNQLTYCALSPQPEFACVDILYALPRMKWCIGPKPGEGSSSVNRAFMNAATQSSVRIGSDALDECSQVFHVKPDPKKMKPHKNTEPAWRTVPSPHLCDSFNELQIYIAAYSDGVGDLLSPCDIGAEIFQLRDYSCGIIAEHVTAQAELARHQRGVGKDNCAMVISKMTLDALIPVGIRSMDEAGKTHTNQTGL